MSEMDTVPVSQFDQGFEYRIFEDVKKCGLKVVVDGNTAVCVMMSPEMYERIMEEIADLHPADSDPYSWISEEEMRKRFNITEDDLKDFESVDIE